MTTTKKVFHLAFVALMVLCVAAQADLEPIEEIFEPAGEWDPKVYGKVAVVQWAQQTPTPINVSNAVAEKFKQKNREILADYVKKAAKKGAEWVLTPEFAVVGYPDIPELPSEQDNFQNRKQVKPYVETVPGPTTRYFSKLAKKLKIWLHVGMAERDAKDDKYYNTVVVLNPKGQIVTKYRKIKLFQLENKFLSKGKDPVTYTGPFGKVGIVICSDIYSNHPMNAYAKAKLDALAQSTSWAQWNTGMRAFQRGAKWVDAHVLASNQNFFPDSGVINPDGSLQSHIRQTTGIAYGYLKYRRAP